MKYIYLIILTCLSVNYSFSQGCGDEQIELIITLQTDQYPSETSWTLTNGQGQLMMEGNSFEGSQLYIDTLCVAMGSCLTMTLFDSFGDGLAAPGFMQVNMDGEEVFLASTFSDDISGIFNCAAGQSCNEAIPVEVGTYEFQPSGDWFIFTPVTNGVYKMSTCGTSFCDTKIWVYDGCTDIVITDNHEGTSFFGDDGDCGVEAEVSGIFLGGDTYIIRVSSTNATCSGDALVISYEGEIEGCTDINSCNFSPLATIDDGSCVGDGEDSDLCPRPDLTMDVGVLKNTLVVKSIENTDACLINEGCMRGYGLRDVINFTTTIANIGDADYFIGEPDANPDQFEYDNCHGHNHYDGYAEYVLYDEFGQYIPIGFKNGFCVLDLTCPSQDMYQYGCNYMGITAGCTDIYSASLECQWIDITDVPDGNYTFVTRVNWDNAPDALGRMEKDTINNWAQVCISLSRQTGAIVMEQINDCEPYIDCLGNQFGKSEQDCKGECNGAALRADIDEDGFVGGMDRALYIELAVEEMGANNCNDLNSDGKVTVYDAAMLNDCMVFGETHDHIDGSSSHDHCTFPAGIFNALNEVQIEVLDIDNDEQSFTLGMRNSGSDILAYQLKIEGINIASVENLVHDFIAEQQVVSNNTNQVIIMSQSNSFIAKTNDLNPVLKVYYNEVISDEACINVVDVVNAKYEQIRASESQICAIISEVSTTDVSRDEVLLYPNPFASQMSVIMNKADDYKFKLYDTSGRLVRNESFNTNTVTIQKENLEEGIYIMTIEGSEATYRAKVIVQY